MMLECKELFYIQLSNKNSSGHSLKSVIPTHYDNSESK